MLSIKVPKNLRLFRYLYIYQTAAKVFWYLQPKNGNCSQNPSINQTCSKTVSIPPKPKMITVLKLTTTWLTQLTLWSNLSYRKMLPYVPFYRSKHDSTPLSSSCDIHQSHTLDGCHPTGSSSLSIVFACFALFQSIIETHKSNMINSFWIRIIKLLNCLKPVTTMLETWHLRCKYTHICSFKK